MFIYSTTIEVGEEIYQQKWWWNYILGGKWKVGPKTYYKCSKN